MTVAGPLLFARYAYPPCDLGYCGPDASPTLLEYGAAGVSDPDLVRLVRGFEGAWPYLQLIAECNGIADPLDPAVVEAYWIGSPLLRAVEMASLGPSLETRFRAQVGRDWDRLVAGVDLGGVPHHSFHVFVVYPWVGLMRTGHTQEPMRVLDRCRVRWGIVDSVESDIACVRTRGLCWDGRHLSLGPLRREAVQWASGGASFVRDLHEGDLVSLHWDWICDRITEMQRASLDRYTKASLRIANGRTHAATSVLG